MPQLIEAMLAGWPLLYPETTDADEQNSTKLEDICDITGEACLC